MGPYNKKDSHSRNADILYECDIFVHKYSHHHDGNAPECVDEVYSEIVHSYTHKTIVYNLQKLKLSKPFPWQNLLTALLLGWIVNMDLVSLDLILFFHVLKLLIRGLERWQLG